MFTESLTMGNNFSVEIQTTNNRGQTPEEVAERCVNKIIGVSNNAHPAIREQALAFRKEMEKVVAIYMRQAIKSDRTTVYNAIKDSGNPKLAEYIRRM
jgi:DNA-binding phage protein